MKSICIKTNNSNIIDYLLENLQTLNLSDVYISTSSFKIYNNIITHYKGNNLTFFINCISSIVTNAIIIFYEETIIRKIIENEFFYFSPSEQETIKALTLSSNITDSANYFYNYNCIFNSLEEYFSEHKTLILDGFVTFRLKNYISSLNDLVSCCVNKFIVNKEYEELIDVLRLYVHSRTSTISQFKEVHLIYINNSKSLLVDKYKKIISLSPKSFRENFVSDISFSNNDYIFNTLIEISPPQIVIHLVNSEPDDFINTLKLIFETKIKFCYDCNICKIYKLNSQNLDF